MKKTFIDLLGEDFTIDFKEHDISKYDVLFHVTPKNRRKYIEEHGILTNQPGTKALVKTDLVFVSYPIDMTTSDCFRWKDDYHALIILDAKALNEDGFKFYDDYFTSEDQSSKRNHLCTDKDIPAKYIKKVVEF